MKKYYLVAAAILLTACGGKDSTSAPAVSGEPSQISALGGTMYQAVENSAGLKVAQPWKQGTQQVILQQLIPGKSVNDGSLPTLSTGSMGDQGQLSLNLPSSVTTYPAKDVLTAISDVTSGYKVSCTNNVHSSDASAGLSFAQVMRQGSDGEYYNVLGLQNTTALGDLNKATGDHFFTLLYSNVATTVTGNVYCQVTNVQTGALALTITQSFSVKLLQGWNSLWGDLTTSSDQKVQTIQYHNAAAPTLWYGGYLADN